MRVGYATWSLDVELGWNARYDPECVTIVPIDNDAAFQLSSAVKLAGRVTAEEVAGEARAGADEMGPATAVSFGKFRGLSVSYVSDDVYWRRTWLAHENVLVFATLNCASHVCALHEPAMLRMLQTLVPENVDA